MEETRKIPKHIAIFLYLVYNADKQSLILLFYKVNQNKEGYIYEKKFC